MSAVDPGLRAKLVALGRLSELRDVSTAPRRSTVETARRLLVARLGVLGRGTPQAPTKEAPRDVYADDCPVTERCPVSPPVTERRVTVTLVG